MLNPIKAEIELVDQEMVRDANVKVEITMTVAQWQFLEKSLKDAKYHSVTANFLKLVQEAIKTVEWRLFVSRAWNSEDT